MNGKPPLRVLPGGAPPSGSPHPGSNGLNGHSLGGAHILGQREPRALMVGIDFETTSTDVTQARICQAASIARCPGFLATPTESCFYVNPDVPIPPSATEVNGITDEMVREAKPFAERIPEFTGLIGALGQPGRPGLLVGYNVRKYDWLVLAYHLVVEGIVGPQPLILDVLDLVCWYHRGLPSRKLGAVAAGFGVGFGGSSLSAEGEPAVGDQHDRAHDALSDVRVTFRVLDVVRARLGVPETLQGDLDLYRLAFIAGMRVDEEYKQFQHYLYVDRDDWGRTDKPRYRLGFGKHSGALLDDVWGMDPSWSDWFRGKVLPELPRAAADIVRLSLANHQTSPIGGAR
jgi:DNA polymerase III epsilon subunit-like protein